MIVDEDTNIQRNLNDYKRKWRSKRKGFELNFESLQQPATHSPLQKERKRKGFSEHIYDD